jgi:uncharacterized protein
MPVRILVDIGHPAHVHFYRNAIRILGELGHDVIVTCNDKDVTLNLLGAYGIPYRLRSRHRGTVAQKLAGMAQLSLRIAKIARRERADILTGINNPYVAQAGWILRRRSVVFDDTELALFINLATFPFATVVCSPRWFAMDIGSKHLKYDGFHELAYLHPDYFHPSPTVRKALSAEGPYVMVRLVAWSASHDLDRSLPKLQPVLLGEGAKRLSSLAKVWIVSERPLVAGLREFAYPLPAETVLDGLAGSAAYIGDGATMATETALLGRPSVYVSPFRFGSMVELERRFGLLKTIRDPVDAISQVETWLKDPQVENEWEGRRRDMLAATVDVTQLAVGLLTRPDPMNHQRG